MLRRTPIALAVLAFACTANPNPPSEALDLSESSLPKGDETDAPNLEVYSAGTCGEILDARADAARLEAEVDAKSAAVSAALREEGVSAIANAFSLQLEVSLLTARLDLARHIHSGFQRYVAGFVSGHYLAARTPLLARLGAANPVELADEVLEACESRRGDGAVTVLVDLVRSATP